MALRSFEEASFLRSVGAQASRARRSLGVEVKDCCQAVQGLTFVGTENWFSSEQERQLL